MEDAAYDERLKYAIIWNNIGELERVVAERNIDINTYEIYDNYKFLTSLQFAIISRAYIIVKYLLEEKNVDPNVKTHFAFTEFEIMDETTIESKNEDIAMLKLLIKHGIRFDTEYNYNTYNIDYAYRAEYPCSAFFWACHMQSIYKVEALLELCPDKIDVDCESGPEGDTAFSWIVSQGFDDEYDPLLHTTTKIVKMFLEQGADVHKKFGYYYDETVLSRAIDNRTLPKDHIIIIMLHNATFYPRSLFERLYIVLEKELKNKK